MRASEALPRSLCLSERTKCLTCSCIFFFKQKTAYEIGLGIPAEPLFRSRAVQQTQNQRYGSSHIGATAKDISNVVTDAASRSEERRVGKECRSRWAPYH